jgi:SecD/SecF fusion protein
MKTLRNILTGIMLIIIIPFCNSQIPVKNKQVIILQSVPTNASNKLLSESKEILLRRLAFMSLRDVQIIQNDAKSELVIAVGDTINRETLSEILLIQGHINFFETINRQEVLKCFGKLSTGCIQNAFTLLHLRDTIHSRSEFILGIAEDKDTISINSCLTSKAVRALLPKQVKLLWSIYPVSVKLYNLYCIASSDKTFNEQDILEAHTDFENPEYPTLCITFKEKMWKLWDDATIRNMNKSIAFVIDNNVYSAPRILGEIPHGKISLTGGGFSKTEVRKLVAIISNGILPLKFTVVSNN